MTAPGSAPRGSEAPCPALQGHLGPLVPGPVQSCKVLAAVGAQGLIDLENPDPQHFRKEACSFSVLERAQGPF